MRDATTILTTIRARGSGGKPLERVYRLLFNRELYLLAYSRISRNAGAMTPGVDGETVDGMAVAKIEAIITLIRQERYRWTPVRRVYIDKKGSTSKRPLGIPRWSDKLVQEVIRLILDAYYEPQFSDHSHGFRPGRGCQTALQEIRQVWVGTSWYIEGDIAQCFDRLDHRVLVDILKEKIHDGRFLRLIVGALRAGYLEDWQWHPTMSGSPQGGIVSPILANLYLDRLDQFVEQTLLPRYNRGKRRRPNPAYRQAGREAKRHSKAGRRHEAKEARKRLQHLPSQDMQDPAYRRLRYLRYADDFLLGFAGPRSEAEEIKQQMGTFLRDHLKLELSETKTLITHGRTGTAHFLGYELVTLQNDAKRCGKKRSINGGIGLRIPREVMREKAAPYLRHGKPIHRPEMENDTVYSIVTQYQAVYRGIVEYYRMAFNLHHLGALGWIMQQSLTKTLAHKLKISVPQVYRRYGTTIQTAEGPRKVLQVKIEREGKPALVAQWGGISLKWSGAAPIQDRQPPRWVPTADLVERLLADRCELCGSQEHVQVHHIRHLRTLQQPGQRDKPLWNRVMAARQRKTLVVCRRCHYDIHYPQRKGGSANISTGEPDDGKLSRPVRRGADGKVRTATG